MSNTTYVKLLSSLGESLTLSGINDVHKTVAISIVILPELSGRLVTSEIVGLESNLINDQLFGVRIDGWQGDSNLD